MTRLELVKRMAESATRALADFEPAARTRPGFPAELSTALHQPVEDSSVSDAPTQRTTDLFIWFEDTSHRTDERRGIAGLPESLLPWPFDGTQSMQVVARSYAEGHLHLLAAVRLRCKGNFGERIAALYTSALSVGTVAWIGMGSQYEQAWRDLYG
jgi:hypothetical protein